MISVLITALVTFILAFFIVPIVLGIARMFGLYAIVNEGSCHVYVLFGKVVAVLTEPGLYFLPFKMGPAAFIINWAGRRQVLDMRLDQVYLRSQAVNSEEGAPMGIGIWY
jgi:regulator of protease activity HflC (stomatin/prohibitin superfamily)